MAFNAGSGWGVNGGGGDPCGEAFELTVREDGDDRVTVFVKGELDLSTAGRLRWLLDEELRRGQAVTLDLSEVAFIDSSGLSAIVAEMRRYQANGGLLRIRTELHPQARRLLELTGLLGLLVPDAA